MTLKGWCTVKHQTDKQNKQTSQTRWIGTLQIIVKSNWQHTSLDETMKSSQPEFHANAWLSSQVLCRKHNIYMYLGEYSTKLWLSVK